MNSLVKVFSNFREFYSEINGATLTGAIDVIVVEQADGSFLCSPFHVRFGKLGVLRSREKIVDVEVNGEPVDIHMKLGESGEAFFVEECPEDDLEQLPANMATSPLPSSDFSNYVETEIFPSVSNDDKLRLPIPRRNSIDISKECDETNDNKFENQVSDYSIRRHTDTMERRNLTAAKKEFTTQKIRQEWAEHEEQILGVDGVSGDTEESWPTNTLSQSVGATPTAQQSDGQHSENKSATATDITFKTIESTELSTDNTKDDVPAQQCVDVTAGKDETKSKKKRRKKSLMKKKASQRKGSSSSSVGSVPSDQNDIDTDTISLSNNTATGGSSNDESPKSEIVTFSVEPDTVLSSIVVKKENEIITPAQRARDLDIHFFSDTEIGSSKSPQGSRPSTPIQSDSEFEMSHREKNELMTNSASWKWGELPTQGEISKEPTTEDAKQAQRNSMLSNMFSFMKQSKKMRKSSSEGVYLSELDTEGMDPEVAALYFPPMNKDDSTMLNSNEDDRESGNGTSLPHSPSSMEGQKSIDSDYEDGKSSDKLSFVAMSMCGGLENGGPSDEEFERHAVQYSEVCQNPSIFASPSLVVRLNGKYYSWAAACPIVMTVLTYQKPLSDEAIEQIISLNKPPQDQIAPNTPSGTQSKRAGYSWWYWGKPMSAEKQDGIDVTKGKELSSALKDGNVDLNAVATQTTRPNSPEYAQQDLNSKFDDSKHNLTGNSEISELNKSLDESKSNEMYRKSLRLTTEQIESLNLKSGMNEISFSVTTAYQGTSRCKCYLFRWKHNDKVVISDIDGTITKSDVLGHILPMVGRDWAQIGVAQLFSKIEENGYKLLYLSARAIGQSRATREYLRSIRQGDVKLPDGPLLLNPTSLISALHREVIEKKPEEFKIACLSDIQALFPQKNPFYAGYGNRINDVWAYRAVGIPIMRIFTINPKGELKHELTQTFQSTYCNMTYIVDQLFPPINDIEESVEFSNFNYWRDPVIDIDLDLVTGTTAVSTSATATSGSNSGQHSPTSQGKQLPTIPENQKV